MRVLLLSGGYDSTAIAWLERPETTLTIDYGQASAEGEIRAAKQVALELGLAHEVLVVDCSPVGSGDLVARTPHELAPAPEWWPFRNQMLLTLASMKALQLDANVILIGTAKTDGFIADGRPQFLETFNALLASQEGQLEVQAPALDFTTAEFVSHVGVPRELLAWSHSCHVAEWACGGCRGCAKALEVREELGYEPSRVG